ncbi:unspecified product [Plasmodium ovale curtisi]|uniref:Unspecified product n=1 Tax=Plasmodium ovale curtisi TaxID=864141 RepID=A0A1A8XAM2_PLAOA|nr:unspecified product [Plasmodium ovale curtisi]
MDLQQVSGSTSIAITSVSSVLGITLLLFMLYEFIPIGSLSNNLREKISTWNINATQYDQHLLYNPVLGNTNSNNNRYNIGYYSLIDS